MAGASLDRPAAAAGALRRHQRRGRAARHAGVCMLRLLERPGVDDRERHLHDDERHHHRALLPGASAARTPHVGGLVQAEIASWRARKSVRDHENLWIWGWKSTEDARKPQAYVGFVFILAGVILAQQSGSSKESLGSLRSNLESSIFGLRRPILELNRSL